MAFDNALWGGRVTDPSQPIAETAAIRRWPSSWSRQDERLVPLLLPVGDGLLTAVKRGLAVAQPGEQAAGCRNPSRPWRSPSSDDDRAAAG